MRYWANLPGFFGPTGKALRRASLQYELACDDANFIAQQIEEITGEECPVVDIKRTFALRWNRAEGWPAVMIRGRPPAVRAGKRKEDKG